MDDIILKYLQEEASDTEKQAILSWLRSGEENKKYFSEIRDIWLKTGQLPVMRPGYAQDAFNRFLADVNTLNKEYRRQRMNYFIKIAASVAVLIICSLGGYFIGKGGISQSVQSGQIVMNQVIMGKDSKGSILLPDGSVAWLNANSKLIYPEHFQADNRRVRLEGEGYFEVVRNEKAPFLVETNGMEVNVLGTHFNVANYAYKQFAETTLLSGKVEIYLPTTKQRFLLKPNQRVRCNPQTGAYQVKDVDGSDYIIWIGDKLVCTNEPLSVILHKIKHWYGLDIVCNGKVPSNQRLSLTIRKESPEEIFKLLALISPIKYTIKVDRIIVEPK